MQAINKLGGKLSDIVRVRIYVVNPDDAALVGNVIRILMRSTPRDFMTLPKVTEAPDAQPAWVASIVGGVKFVLPSMLVGMDVDAVVL